MQHVTFVGHCCILLHVVGSLRGQTHQTFCSDIVYVNFGTLLQLGYGSSLIYREQACLFTFDYLTSMMETTRKRKAVAAMIILELLEGDEERNWKRGKTRKWIKRREEQGYFDNIVRELSIEDTAGFKEMMRMSYEEFLGILQLIEKDITPKQIIGGTKVICAKARLTVAIRFLATGETYRSLSFQFRISKGAISYIVTEVCEAIIRNVSPLYLKVPSSAEEWLEIAEKFSERWQFPNCLGAIDGKHIVMQPPPEAGSYFYNYKHTHSIVLLAVAGPDYECTYVDVGTNGRVSDGGIWNKCSLSKAIDNGIFVYHVQSVCLLEKKKFLMFLLVMMLLP